MCCGYWIKKNLWQTERRTLGHYTSILFPLPSLGDGGGVREGSKIISNKTNSMNNQSNLNIKYNIHVHFTGSIHLFLYKISGRSKISWPSPKIFIFWYLVQRPLQRYIWLGGTIQFWKSYRIPNNCVLSDILVNFQKRWK